jgi:hypothetical protein
LQNPDSESAYALVESYVSIWEATRDDQWLVRGGEASRQLASWVVSYDYDFPPDSMFGRAGIRPTGAVYANTQNKHAAPGLCTASGLALLKLFRATGDGFHANLLGDIARGLPQYLPTPQRPLGDACDDACREYQKLAANPACASLFQDRYFSLPGQPDVTGLDATVDGGNRT